MPSLVIPESGLSLGSPQMTPFKPGSALPAVVGLSLTDGMIEEMIKCVQNGKEIQLSLGDRPVSFQSNSQCSRWCLANYLLLPSLFSSLTIESLPIEVD